MLERDTAPYTGACLPDSREEPRCSIQLGTLSLPQFLHGTEAIIW